MPDITFPGDSDRMLIVGSTGSGKTQAGMYWLSRRDLLIRPWIVYDFKFDELINQIEGARHLGMEEKIPDQPGLYIYHPVPDDDDDVLTQQFRNIWRQENTGVFVDEGYMIRKNDPGFRALLTQGRSKHIPMITLSQRPVWMDNFIISETNYIQIFRLQRGKDLDAVNDFVGGNLEAAHGAAMPEVRLPDYWSFYYAVGANKLWRMKPLGDRLLILSNFKAKLQTLDKKV